MAPARQAKRSSAPVFIACKVSDVVLSLRPLAAEAAFGGEVEQLPADHAAETGSAGEFEHQFAADIGVGMDVRPGENIEGHGQQRIAGQNGGGFVEGLVHGRPAAAQVVIVHRRQVVVRQ